MCACKLTSDHQFMTKAAIESLPKKNSKFLEPEVELLISEYCEFPDKVWSVYGQWGGWSGFPNDSILPDYRREWNISHYCGWDPFTDDIKKRVGHEHTGGYKACRTYPKKAWDSFDNRKHAEGVMYMGILSHHIEDCATFADMQALHRGHNFDFKQINIMPYRPKLLGNTRKTAINGIVRRLRELVNYCDEKSLILRKYIRDNNQKQFALLHLNSCNEGAKAIADTFHTIITLAGKKTGTKIANPYGVNLVNNPSFETDDGSRYPANWVASYKNLNDKISQAEYEGLIAHDMGLCHSGMYSAKIMWAAKEGVEWIQRWPDAIPVRKNETYRCSGWIRTQDATGQSYICVYLYKNNNEKVGEFRSRKVSGTCDWKKVSFEFTIPQDANKLRVACHSKNNNGASWFDDIELVKVRKSEKAREENTPDLVLSLDFNEKVLRDQTPYRNSSAVRHSVILDSSPHYELNAPIITCSGTKISDLHVNNASGIAHALKFDGKDDFLEVPCSLTNDVLDPADEFTIVFWLYIAQKKDAYIICKEAEIKNEYHGYRIDTTQDGFLRLVVSDERKKLSVCCAKYETNKWTHIAVTLQKNRLMQLYINGNLKDKKKINGKCTGCDRSFYIGSDHGVDAFFKGMVAKVKIYRSVLLPRDIIRIQ